MMVIAVGLSSYNLALFHLVNHAFYKGLLFLGAGAVIHAWADNQDFRKYGGLRVFLPLSYTVMLIASLSLVAFPFMTGFYSKDFILESAYGYYSFSSIVVYFIATIGAMFTTLYSVKVLYLTFLTNPNGPLINYNKAHEGDIFMSIPLILLALFSIFFGYLTKDIFIGMASGFFLDNSLFIHPSHEVMLDTEFAVPSFFKLLPLVLTISLTIISLVVSEYLPSRLISFKFSRLGYNVFSFFNQRFLIELLYNKYVTGLIFKFGAQTTKVLDKGFVEVIGPFGMEKILLNISRNVARLDTGVITSYALYILIGLLFYMITPFLSILDNNILLLIILGLYVNIGEFDTNYYITTIKNRLTVMTSFSSGSILVSFICVGFVSGFVFLTGTEPGSGSAYFPWMESADRATVDGVTTVIKSIEIPLSATVGGSNYHTNALYYLKNLSNVINTNNSFSDNFFSLVFSKLLLNTYITVLAEYMLNTNVNTQHLHLHELGINMYRIAYQGVILVGDEHIGEVVWDIQKIFDNHYNVWISSATITLGVGAYTMIFGLRGIESLFYSGILSGISVSEGGQNIFFMLDGIVPTILVSALIAYVFS